MCFCVFAMLQMGLMVQCSDGAATYVRAAHEGGKFCQGVVGKLQKRHM